MKLFIVRTSMIMFVGVACIVLASCSSTTATSMTSTNGTSGNTVATATQNASATLKHSPAGKVDLVWEPTTHLLTATITLSGLAPKSTHQAHIHAGTCQSAGKTVIFPLQNVVADATGNASSTTSIRGVMGGIPASGWYINVHNGPDLTPDDQYMSIACANIANPSPSLNAVQKVAVPLVDAPSPDQSASGTAQLTLANGQVKVVLSMKGLEPASTHAAHIHAGSCADQGKIIYPLTAITADKTGAGTSTTILKNMASLPASGWYINVHFGSTITNQTNEDPIACGNMILSH